jgi:hypothetical protein
MALAFAATYDDKAMREDLLDVLVNLSPKETQLISGLGTTTASQIRHETLVDTLSAVKVNAQIEGADATYHTPTNPARLYNYTQIFTQGYKVSNTERAVDTAGYKDRYQYEVTKALAMLKNDMEYAAMRGTLASGAGTTARSMQGVKYSLSLVTNCSGISMTEAFLNDYFQWVWTNASTEVNAVYGAMYIKRKISAFTAGTTKNTNQDDRRLVNAVDTYEADAAHLVKLFAHRYVTVTGDSTGNNLYDVVGMDEDKFRIAYLRKPTNQDSSNGGDWTGGNVTTEMTLECRHYNAGFWAKNCY